jgi:hypothetical protein
MEVPMAVETTNWRPTSWEHMTATISYVVGENRERMERGETDSTLMRYGKHLPIQEALELLAEMRADGLTNVPACDSVLPDGTCAGHRETADAPA